MSDKSVKDSPPVTMTLTDDEIVAVPSVSRRTALQMIGGGVAVATAATVIAAPTAAQAKVTDRDQNDMVHRGRGHSDSDPNDRVGGGRTGHTDHDPNDRAGGGRTGHTDHDPNDAGGHGRN